MMMVVAVVAALGADPADDESALSEFTHCNPNKQQKILFLKARDGSKTPPDLRDCSAVTGSPSSV